jgi:ABC-2 type transport system ATP-binding protein
VTASAITVDDVTKRFRLYHERNQSLKATLLRGGRARYEEFMALDGVSVDVAEGSTLAFVGENGSGKSTLLKCIARILRPDSGHIRVDGKMSALLELGAGFHPELSGRENVYLNGAILGLSTRELKRRFDDIVDFAGLHRFIDTPVKNYSSGMYVRLGFSVAINVEPDVLLVDEVLAVGDENFQSKCAERFAELRADGKTIVIVSHSLPSVRSMADAVVWLAHGKVRMAGGAAEVIDAYVAESHEGHEQGGTGARWGSGEAVVERVELLDADGRLTERVCTGDTVTVRLHYRAHERVPRPVFGLAVHTLDGVHVTGPNTREFGLVPDEIEGTGIVDLHVPRLMLLPGTYDISVSLVDFAALHVFDFQQRLVRFDVDAGEPHETFGGVVSLGGAWSLGAGPPDG